jgi:ribosome assembly protein YihI (activator of Der GTPase)
MSDPLAAYLHDHLAGSNFAIELLKNLEEQRAGEALGAFAASELALLLEDRGILQGLVDRMRAESSAVKEAAAWVAEKASRFKLRHPRSRDFEAFEALELLAIGVHGRIALWRVLSVLAHGDPRLGGRDFETLAVRAQQQHDRVEQQRMQIAPSALRPS